LRAVGQLVEAGDAAAVEADGLDVHLHQHLEVEAVVGAEGFKVRDVLEVVGVQLAVAQRQVGKDIVVEHHDLEIDALGGQVRLHKLQHLRVGHGGRAHLEHRRLGGCERSAGDKQADEDQGGQDGSAHEQLLLNRSLYVV